MNDKVIRYILNCWPLKYCFKRILLLVLSGPTDRIHLTRSLMKLQEYWIPIRCCLHIRIQPITCSSMSNRYLVMFKYFNYFFASTSLVCITLPSHSKKRAEKNKQFVFKAGFNRLPLSIITHFTFNRNVMVWISLVFNWIRKVTHFSSVW